MINLNCFDSKLLLSLRKRKAISPKISIYCFIIVKPNSNSFSKTNRGGVEDTRLEAKAKDPKKIRGQGQGPGQPFRGQTLSRPRTGMLKAKDTSASALQKKKGLHKNFLGDLQKKKVFTKIFQAISTKKRFPKNFSSTPQNFNNSKIVLSSSRGQANFRGLEAKDLTFEAKDFKMCPRGQGRPRGLHL